MRTLTKSRFKLGLECPNKLYYTKKDQYANQKQNDPFLQALASGGFQVEELARLHYPNGKLIDDICDDFEIDLPKYLLEIRKAENKYFVIIFNLLLQKIIARITTKKGFKTSIG